MALYQTSAYRYHSDGLSTDQSNWNNHYAQHLNDKETQTEGCCYLFSFDISATYHASLAP